jgi:CheY-like chemotaxis protein
LQIPSFSGKSVLVIDDEEDARLLMKHLLEELGCKVLTAASGHEGVDIARTAKPDLITTDLLMPEMNGWDVVRSIHSDPVTCRIPVVVVSIVGTENRGGVVGSVDVLDKPVSRDMLSSLLTRRLTARARVLVVDDDPDALKIVEGYLAETGVQIVNASNGEEALEVLGRVEVDLIILDLLMPVMDGLTFLSTLQRHDRYRDLAVVVLTSKSLSGEEQKTLRHHTVKVLKKAECSPEDLKEVLESVWAQDSGQKGTQRDGDSQSADLGRSGSHRGLTNDPAGD